MIEVSKAEQVIGLAKLYAPAIREELQPDGVDASRRAKGEPRCAGKPF
jgi:hypothetical protein